MKLNPYLNFAGNAEEAFNFYRSVFGGEFASLVRFKDMPMPGMTLPPDEESKLMHVALKVEEDRLMASDILRSRGMQLNAGNNVYLSLTPESKEEADRLFAALSAGGAVEMPLAMQAWGDYYGSFKDKFGVMWMIDYTPPKQ